MFLTCLTAGKRVAFKLIAFDSTGLVFQPHTGTVMKIEEGDDAILTVKMDSYDTTTNNTSNKRVKALLNEDQRHTILTAPLSSFIEITLTD